MLLGFYLMLVLWPVNSSKAVCDWVESSCCRGYIVTSKTRIGCWMCVCLCHLRCDIAYRLMCSSSADTRWLSWLFYLPYRRHLSCFVNNDIFKPKTMVDFYLLLVYEDFVIRRGTGSIGVTLSDSVIPAFLLMAFFSRSLVISPIHVFTWCFHASSLILQVISEPIFYKRMHLTERFNAITAFRNVSLLWFEWSSSCKRICSDIRFKSWIFLHYKRFLTHVFFTFEQSRAFNFTTNGLFILLSVLRLYSVL